ncbi:12808_t:CDS:2, partial [Ambispora leptoticha]
HELAHSCQVNAPKQIVDTTIKPCMSTADAIRSDVNQGSSVGASPLHSKTQHECTKKTYNKICVNKIHGKLVQNSDLSTVAISSSFVTLHESEQSDELIPLLEKNLIVEQELMQQLSLIIGGASTAENKVMVGNTDSQILDQSSVSAQSIVHMFREAIRSGQNAILCWYHFAEKYDKRIDEVSVDKKVEM